MTVWPLEALTSYAMLPCTIDGCASLAYARGLCNAHYAQWLRGQLPEDAAAELRPFSEEYAAVHKRLETTYGPAITLTCVDCGMQAAHWSWDRTGPSRKEVYRGIRVTWGTDIADYSPRCVSHALIKDHGGTLTEYPCGHPRTRENTESRGCKTCARARNRRRMRERYQNDPEYRERLLARLRERAASRREERAA